MENSMTKTTNYKVADITLSNFGRKEISLAEKEMPGLMQLREKYGEPPPGYTCPICLKGEDELQGTGGNASVWVIDHNHDTDEFRAASRSTDAA